MTGLILTLLIIGIGVAVVIRLNPNGPVDASWKLAGYVVGCALVVWFIIFVLPRSITSGQTAVNANWMPVLGNISLMGWSFSPNAPVQEVEAPASGGGVEISSQPAYIVVTATPDPALLQMLAATPTPVPVVMPVTLDVAPGVSLTATQIVTPVATVAPAATPTVDHSVNLGNLYAQLAQAKEIGDRYNGRIVAGSILSINPADALAQTTLQEIANAENLLAQRQGIIALAQDEGDKIPPLLFGATFEVVAVEQDMWRTVWEKTATIKQTSPGWLHDTDITILRGHLQQLGASRIGDTFTVSGGTQGR